MSGVQWNEEPEMDGWFDNYDNGGPDYDYEPHEPEDYCPTCGGEGTAEYQDCPEAWGEDCPSLVNHLITCPNCGGSGLMRDAKSI